MQKQKLGYSKYDQKLQLTIRIMGDAPTYKDLASLTKFNWKVRGKFQFVKFEEAIYTISFRETVDYLRCCDRKFDTLGDIPLLISKKLPKTIFEETYVEVPQ